jgi:Helicase conserved C-terminal domain
LSFYTTAGEVVVRCAAGRYTTVHGNTGADDESGEPPAHRRSWKRSPTMSEWVPVSGSRRGHAVLDEGRGRLDVVWRIRPGGNLVTVTLSNNRRLSAGQAPDRAWDDLLTQVELEVTLPANSLLEYPRIARDFSDLEEQELDLQYSRHRTYAIGHGVAVTWSFSSADAVISAAHIPSSVIPATSTQLGPEWQVDPLAFDAQTIGDESSSKSDICDALDSLVHAYSSWADRLDTGVGHEDASTIIGRVRQAASRMANGVHILRTDDAAWSAFTLANRAMVLQYSHSRADQAGTRRSLANPADLDSDVVGRPWRPFQIAFLLLTVHGLTDPTCDDRDLVDLIWFPTGGGKTEAYLLVAMFEIFRRRLTGGAGGQGTTVISRYTLSLLTTQQFQRAAGALLAGEVIRRQRTDLGEEPISIGLWVGDVTTRNKITDARKDFAAERNRRTHNDIFMIERCPWCGTEIMPREHNDDDAVYGVRAGLAEFELFCPREECPFHDRLPILVVDEMLYQSPPTFLVATVDKFADLAWDQRGGAFIGNYGRWNPPSLIIQDELHLLTGPLGTTAALYEHAIELACAVNGRDPKVIASTATIRRASDQVQALFGKRVSVFPPAGVDQADSFFATADRSSPGRQYLGIMPQGHTSDTSIVHLLAAMLQAPVNAGLTGWYLDAFWTVVAYHNSLQELGRTVTIARDDVPARMLARFGDQRRPVPVSSIEELTANVERYEQPRLLERLGCPHNDREAISVLAATNMLSVGVDVPRLGVMLMVGQPKTTAEYIQATSRVGRSTPGLVVTLFRSTRPRDRSHYESFASFHGALYRNVEPATVTPYSVPSQRRALHAALVIMVRHKLGLRANDAPFTAFPAHTAEIEGCVHELVEIIRQVDPQEVDGAERRLRGYVEHWRDLAETLSSLNYSDYAAIPGPRLLKDFGQSDNNAWSTPRSMRNVDRESALRPLGRVRDRGPR